MFFKKLAGAVVGSEPQDQGPNADMFWHRFGDLFLVGIVFASLLGFGLGTLAFIVFWISQTLQ